MVSNTVDNMMDRDSIEAVVENLWSIGKTREEISRTIIQENLVDLDTLTDTLNGFEFKPENPLDLNAVQAEGWTFAGLATTLIAALADDASRNLPR